MYKEEAIELFTEYFEDFNVRYRWIPTPADVNYEELSFVTNGMKNSPCEFDETTIDFGTSSISARSYYNIMGEIIVSLNPERFSPPNKLHKSRNRPFNCKIIYQRFRRRTSGSNIFSGHGS